MVIVRGWAGLGNWGDVGQDTKSQWDEKEELKDAFRFTVAIINSILDASEVLRADF